MTTQKVWITYNEDVKRFIISKIRDTQVAEDLLQETFIKIHTKLNTLKDDSKLKSWVFTIARNTVLDFFKATTLTREVFETDVISDTDDDYSTHNEKDCLKGIIKSLPKKYREPLFLADIKGLKQAEVARTLKLQLPTTKSRIQRARKLIAQGYMECCDLQMNQDGYLVGEIKDKADCKVCN